MTTAERIDAEAKRLPEALAGEVLAFILNLERQRSLPQPNLNGDPQAIMRLAGIAQASFPVVEKSVRDGECMALRNEWDRLP